MMRLTRTYNFQAAHLLPRVPPAHKCSRLHGHSYRLTVSVQGDVSHATGMVIDFDDIDKIVAPLVDEHLDHQYLNDIATLENPTVENLAIWVWDKLKPDLPLLNSVEVSETRNNAAIYEGPSM